MCLSQACPTPLPSHDGRKQRKRELSFVESGVSLQRNCNARKCECLSTADVRRTSAIFMANKERQAGRACSVGTTTKLGSKSGLSLQGLQRLLPERARRGFG